MKSRLQLGLTALAVLLFTTVFAQTTISTIPPLSANNGSTAITFEMTTSSSILVTGVSNTFNTGTISAELWYRIGGVLPTGQTTPSVTTANGWVQAGTATIAVTTNTAPTAIPIANLSIPVNPGTPVGFCVTGGTRYMTYDATLANTHTGGGATVHTGPGYGFGGSFPAPTIATRSFVGSVTFSPAGPCVNPPYLGTATSDKLITCSGENFTLGVDSLTSGTGQSYQWQISSNGTTWTNIPGATVLQYQTSQTTSNYYRLQSTCTATTSSAAVQVTTSATALPGGTYTINGNFVTGGTNFNSFTDFKQAIVCGGIAGPVVVNVISKGSAYNEQVEFGSIGGASAINTITINGNNETITHVGGGSNFAVMRFNGSSYFKIKKLKVLGSGTASNFGVQLTNNASFIEFDSCTVSINQASTSSTTAAFVASGSLTSATTAGATANNITVKNSIIEGGYYCFTMMGPTSAPFSSNNIIENNTIRDFYLYGLYCTNQNNTSIKNNDVNRSQRMGTLSTFYGMYFNGNMTDVKVFGNKLHNPGDQNTAATFTAYTMYMSSANATATNPMIVANNAIYELNGSGLNYAIYLLSGNFINLYHNTISVDNYFASTSASAQRALFIGASSGTFEIKNNIFQMTHVGSGVKHVIFLSSAIPTFSIDYNQYYLGSSSGSNSFGSYAGTTVATFAAWQAVNSGAFDANATYGDAVFALDYYTPQSSVGNNNGTNLLSIVPTDINGVARTATPDKGSVEFVPLTCLQPYSYIGSSTSSTISLTWTNVSGADSVLIEYGPSGFTQGTGLTMYAGSSAQITGLFSNTCYDFYFTSMCGGSLGNGTGLFVYCTTCAAVATPLFEGFEGIPAGSTTSPSMPACWSYWENPASTGSCYGYTYASVTPIGTQHFRMYNFNSATDTLAIISPAIMGLTAGNKQIKFKAKSSSSTLTTPLIVGTSPTSTNLRNATIIDTIQTDGANYSTEFAVNLDTASGYNGTDEYVFIMHTGTPVSYYLAYVDDIKIENIPTCSPPWNIAASSITSTGASISWSTLFGTCFKMEYGPMGFVQGTGQGTIVNNITSPHSLSGLTPNTFYDVYLADCCNPGVWAGPFTFKTNCTVQLSGTYTVGGTPGATNFVTLASAIAALNGCGITGPVTFNIQAGTHTIPATVFGSIPGVSATNTITFNGGNKATTTIGFNAGSTIALTFDGAKYMTFKNVTISAPASDRQIWLTNNANYITFDYCDILGSSTTTSSLTCVIAATGTSASISATGNNANFITITNCKLVGGYYGFSTYGSGTTAYTSNFVVTDNEFVDQYYYPIRFYYAENITLEGNIANVTRNTSGYGLYAYYVTNATIKRNQLFAPTYAMYMYNSNLNAASSYVEISNNFLGATTSYGLYLNIPNNVNVYHNSVRGGSYATYITGAASNVNVKNNIFESNSNYAAYIATTPSNFSLDYNIYNTGGSSIAYQGAAYTTLATWKTGQPLYNTNSIQGNPGYASTSDFHIIGTLPNNVGLNGLATVDIDGDMRPASGSTTVDIGADEFTPLNWDVQAAGISEPEDLSCGDSTTVIKAVFSNYGLQTVTSVSATAFVTGSTTATLTGTFSGSVPSLGQDTIVLSSFNTAAGGTYNIEVVLNLTGDQDASNDTVSMVVTLNDILPRQPLASKDSVCAGQFDTLYFPSNAGNLSFQWLTTNGDTISTADSLIVGPMSANDTTFVLGSLSSSYNVGPIDNSIGASANYTAMNHYLQFTVTNPTTIKSVDVIANGAGLVDVVIQDGTSLATLFTHTVAIPAGGNQTLVLNQPLPPGTYRMGGTTVNNAGGLQRNSAGASYPYTSPDGSVSITGNTFSASYYYFFYNWEIGTGGCPRPDGEVTIYNAGTLSAAFTSNLNPPTMTDLTVDFDASSSIGATSYAWDFGDGSNGSGATPSHTYLANGTYTVTLLVTGICGVDTISSIVTIAGIGLEESLLNQTLSVFPNPSNGKFRVEFQVEGLKNVSLRVSSLLGQEVYSSKPGNISGKYTEEIDLSKEASAVYVLQIITDDNVVSRRITIRK